MVAIFGIWPYEGRGVDIVEARNRQMNVEFVLLQFILSYSITHLLPIRPKESRKSHGTFARDGNNSGYE